MIFRTVVVLGILFSCLPASAQEISKQPLTKKTELLKNRLVIMLPEGAKIEPRGHNLMAAPQPDDSETRVVLEAKNGEKLVLMGTDLHAYREIGEFAKAIQDCTTSIKKRASVADAYDERAQNYLKQGKKSLAQKDLNAAKDIRSHTFSVGEPTRIIMGGE